MPEKVSKKYKIIGTVIVFGVLLTLIGATKNNNPSYIFIPPKITPFQSKPFKIGDPIQMDRYNFTLNSVKNTYKISSNDFTIAHTSNNFFIIKLTLKNPSNNPLSGLLIKTNNIFTLKSNHNNYSVDFNATNSANIIYKTTNSFNILNGMQLNPFTQYTCYIVFLTSHSVNMGTVIVNIDNTIAKINL